MAYDHGNMWFTDGYKIGRTSPERHSDPEVDLPDQRDTAQASPELSAAGL
jgi:hypothetical protein